MSDTFTDMTLGEAVERALDGHKSMIRCPGHADGTPSLSVAPGTLQRVVAHCHAGCTQDAIFAGGGVEWSEVCTERPDESRATDDVWTPAGNASNVYRYRNADGHVVFEVLRVPRGEGKTFMQRHFDIAQQKYVWSTEGCELMLYLLPEVLAAVSAGETIYVCEGEKDVHTLRGLGLAATCNARGAGKWRPEYSDSIAGARVVICSDNDSVGRAHARQVREQLIERGCTVKVVEAAKGKDITEHLRMGGSMDTVLTVTPEDEAERQRFGTDVLALINRQLTDIVWVVPRLIASGERLLITGFEGHGKSTLLRQFAIMVAAGLNPFTGARIEPKRVLFIDAENHPSQTLESWKDLVGLASFHANDPIAEGMLTVLEEWDNSDLDLAAPDGASWLSERVHAYRPDIVFMGPLTNMVGRDLKDDEPVRRLRNAVNSSRSVCGSAFVMEHHAPHKGPMDKERQVRPYGSSMFLKWPDFGYGLKPTENESLYEWQRTRYPRVRSRAFPTHLRVGERNLGEWPWVETVPETS